MAQVLEVVLGDIGTTIHPCLFINLLVCLCVSVCMHVCVCCFAVLHGLVRRSGILQDTVSSQ